MSELQTQQTPNGLARYPAAAVVKVPVAHPSTGRSSLGGSFLHYAGDVAVDRKGQVYVANFTNQDEGAPIGQVLRLKQ